MFVVVFPVVGFITRIQQISAICVEVCPLAALAVNVPKPIHPGYVYRVARKKHRPGTSIVGVGGDL